MLNFNLNFLKSPSGKDGNGRITSNGGALFISKSELEQNKALAEASLFGIRASERAMGFKRDDSEKNLNTLDNNIDPDKINELINQAINTNNQQITGTDLETHPELPYLGGSNQIIIPQEKIDVAKRREKNRKELANRLRAKSAPRVFNKMQSKPENKPENKPNYVPPKLKPPGIGG